MFSHFRHLINGNRRIGLIGIIECLPGRQGWLRRPVQCTCMVEFKTRTDDISIHHSIFGFNLQCSWGSIRRFTHEMLSWQHSWESFSGTSGTHMPMGISSGTLMPMGISSGTLMPFGISSGTLMPIGISSGTLMPMGFHREHSRLWES